MMNLLFLTLPQIAHSIPILKDILQKNVKIAKGAIVVL